MNSKQPEIVLTDKQIDDIAQKVASFLMSTIINFSSHKKMNIDEVIKYLGICRSSIFEFIKKGNFPKPMKIGRLSKFDKDEIDSWLEEKKLRIKEEK
jgi:excisionase family DNA binding protein